jgi:hypothetical protein
MMLASLHVNHYIVFLISGLAGSATELHRDVTILSAQSSAFPTWQCSQAALNQHTPTVEQKSVLGLYMSDRQSPPFLGCHGI